MTDNSGVQVVEHTTRWAGHGPERGRETPAVRCSAGTESSDEFSRFNDRDLLPNADSIKHEEAEAEYESSPPVVARCRGGGRVAERAQARSGWPCATLRPHASVGVLRQDIPYFLWSGGETLSEDQLRLKPRSEDTSERVLWMSRVMREAKFEDVWQYLTLEQVLRDWPLVENRLGRSRPLWVFMLDGWRRLGLIPASQAR